VFETFGAQVGFFIGIALGLAGGFAFVEWLVEKDDG
tara:strand:- start:139 stop:246 length:108 start_codon:yes stop_codon:yes gene_type:complete